MKFSFICIVSFVSCSVCETNDIDVYTGLDFDFDFDAPKDVARIENDKIPRFYRSRYPYQNRKLDYYKAEIPREYEPSTDKHRRYQEIIDWQRSQLHKHRPTRERHVSPKLQFILDNLAKSPSSDLDVPQMQLPEDSRMYQTDENAGLRFDYEKDEDDTQRLFDERLLSDDYRDNERLLLDSLRPDNDRKFSLTDFNLFDKNEREAITNRFGHVKIAENPSEFAYPPSDSRFYEKLEENIETTTKLTNVKLPTTIIPSEKLLVESRSDKVPVENGKPKNDERKDGIRVVPLRPALEDENTAGVYIIAVVAGISAAATVGLIAVGIGWYNLQKHVKNASDVEYPAYGVTGPNKDISPSGDRRLAQSAQMYHYQHQKQQIIAMERAPPGERHGSASEAESDEENEEGDYTVYECPGLAPTGEMEVKNPLFQDDPTPAQTPATKVDDEKDDKESVKK